PHILFPYTTRLRPQPSPFPYTTLFRSNASPSITSAVLPKPSLPSWALSVLVLPSATSRLSMTRRLPSLAFDDSAIFSPSARTFRSEEHTSESSHDQISYAVFCLKKKKT